MGYNYTKAINTALEAPLGISQKLTQFEIYLTKLIGGTTGACVIRIYFFKIGFNNLVRNESNREALAFLDLLKK